MNLKLPLVSVVINCYNGERHLNEAINSIYSQTYTNWEIIFWDNASTDNSAAIAKSYDHKLKYYYSDINTPLSKARFQAVKKAKGEYLGFLDCDDLWNVDKLEKQVSLFLKNNSFSFVYGKAEIIYDKTESLFKKTKKNIIPNIDVLLEGQIFNQLIIEDFIPFPSVLIDKAKLLKCGDFPLNYNHSIDYWIFLNLAYKFNVGALNEICCKYRIHERSLSSKQIILCSLENIDLIKSFLPDERAKKALKFHYTSLAIAYLKRKKFFLTLCTLYEYNCWSLFLIRIIKKLMK